MVRSHPTHNRTRLWPLTTCMGFGFGITRQFLQRYKSGSLSVSSRWHRVRPLTTTAAWGRVKSTSHGASQTRRTRWMLWSGACHCLLYLTPLTVPNIDHTNGNSNFAERNTRQTTHSIYSVGKQQFAECFLSCTQQINLTLGKKIGLPSVFQNTLGKKSGLPSVFQNTLDKILFTILFAECSHYFFLSIFQLHEATRCKIKKWICK